MLYGHTTVLLPVSVAEKKISNVAVSHRDKINIIWACLLKRCQRRARFFGAANTQVRGGMTEVATSAINGGRFLI